MTLTVEDGSLVANANSYISATDFTTYATARSYTLVSGAETLLIQAMDYLESQLFIGKKYTETQALQWPRDGAYIDGYLFAYDDIPQELINAQCEIAIAIDQGNGPLIDVERKTIMKKVGPIEVQYASGSAPFTVNRKIRNALWKLLAAGAGGNNINVNRG